MTDISPIPEGFTAVTPHLHVEGAAKAIDFYKTAFGAEEASRKPMPNDPNLLMHALIFIHGAPVMLVDAMDAWGNRGPKGLGGTTVAIHLYVPDCDTAFRRAVDAGCTSTMEPNDAFWGDRFAAVSDPFGHAWTIATRTRMPTEAEMAADAAKMFGG